MQQDIRYGGYSANRSDYESGDGELAVSMGLVNEEGQLKPVQQPAELCVLPANHTIMFIHKTATFTHYIVLYTFNHTLYWFDESVITGAASLPVDSQTIENSLVSIHEFYHTETNDNFDPPIVTRVNDGIYEINAVGNTLVVLAEDGMHYILWKDGYYKYLGQKPPFVEIQFGLSENKNASYNKAGTTNNATTYNSAWAIYNKTPNECLETINNTTHTNYFKSDQIDGITNTVWAMVNEANSLIAKEGHFYAPFFVRYCYRMYDGTSIIHSAPVFMPVSSPSAYRVTFVNGYSDPNNTDRIYIYPYSLTNPINVTPPPDSGTSFIELTNKLLFRYAPNNTALTYHVLDETTLTTLKTDWQDIIKTIDIYVSRPIIREDNGEKIKSISVSRTSHVLRVSSFSNVANDWTWTDVDNYTHIQNIYCDIPLLPEDVYLDKIHSVDSFYKVHSFNLDSDTLATSGYEELSIGTNTLTALAGLETLKDEGQQHNSIFPLLDDTDKCVTSLFNYNGRLNIAAPSVRLFEGFSLKTLTPRCTSASLIKISAIYVFLNTEQGEKIVMHTEEDLPYINTALIFNCPLYYPENRATKMRIIYQSSSNLYQFELPMKECPLINGSFTNGGIFSSLQPQYVSQSEETIYTNDILKSPYKLYTSEVDNPFFFPNSGVVSVGTGIIRGISTAAKALSEGQFGQYPLYAFTTDGVWALEVSSTGTFTAKQPITRDVLLEPESLCQIDSAVLFATERGIMLISGSQTQCISDILLSNSNFDPADLPRLGEVSALTTIHLSPFKDFLQGCRMAYDYPRQRIVVYNPTTHIEGVVPKPTYPYAYVFSLKSKLWGLMPTNLLQTLNSYPDALALTQEDSQYKKSLVDVSGSMSGDDADTSTQQVLLVTRPLKLGDCNVLKTVNTVAQRGMFHKGSVKSILYGSRDLWNWHLVASSQDEWMRGLHGTPYKWFRIAVLATLGKDESISGATVEFEPRHAGRLH